MITILGDGAFGTALAQVIAGNGHQVTLWCYNPEVALSITSKRCNELYLPAIDLHPNIHTSLTLTQALQDTSWIVEAIPVAHLYSVLSTIKDLNTQTPWVLASKGISHNQLPSEILSSTLGSLSTVILSGPSFARELASGVPTGLTLASTTHAEPFRKIIESNTVVIDTTTDVIGTQLCGALKNVIALTLGILEGAHYGSNTQALVFTQMIKELAQIIKDKGGSQETIMLLAGIGDLTLTAFNSQSRNKTLGKAIGRKEYLNKELPYTEGVNTLRSLPEYLKKDYPLFNAVHQIALHQKELETLIDCIKK